MTDTPEMVERIMAAINSHQCTLGPGAHVYRMSDGAVIERCSDDLDAMNAKDRWNARAAIEAMREPTEVMAECLWGDDAKQSYRNAIDAALETSDD